MRTTSRAAIAASIGCALLASTVTVEANADVGDPTDAVTTWNLNAGKAATAACLAPASNPLHESRMYAMAHIAIHDALNDIDRRARSYAYDGPQQPGASPEAAVAAAARGAMVAALNQLTEPFGQPCIDAGVASVEADYTVALAGIPRGPAKTQGIALGEAAAAAIVDQRSGDGSDTLLVDSTYPQGDEPGEYVFTPGTPFAFAPHWGEVTPFALRRASSFKPGPPLRLSSAKYAADVNEIKALGGDGVTTPSARTSDQTEIALFWLESSPLAWNRIARTVSASSKLDLWENARLFGLLNMALADGYIGSFDTKYDYNFWRPVTAIQQADTDGNDRTAADPTWTPLVTTPPIPDYDSAHTVEGAAAAAVLRGFFRTDRIGFEACSLTLPAGSTCADDSPVRREFGSFSGAAQENGVSRIYVGFHFRDAVDAGMRHGRQIGKHTVATELRPVH
ncbi:MAG: vanadium-dependent haloperoxidase [Candidatus Nanopelagicales bacterium]